MTRSAVQDLRNLFDAQGIDAYLVPRADLFQGEEVAACDERLAFISGFTGSAGWALITRDAAHLFVDGRYTLQGAEQSPDFIQHDLIDEPWTAIAETIGGKVGFDPWLLTKRQADRPFLKPIVQNLVDAVWTARPASPAGKIWPHDITFAGESSADKRARLAQKLVELGADHAVLTLPDSIAWLLNIRGQDLRNTPVVRGCAIVSAKDHDVSWFFDAPERVDFPLDATCAPFDLFAGAVRKLNGAVLVDPTSAPVALDGLVSGDVLSKPDPIIAMKAVKNADEIEGIKAAHRRDGKAVAQFIRWIKAEAPKGELNELDAVAKLRSFREADSLFLGDSFDTISGSGPNGAIVHYRVSQASNRPLEVGSLYLCDSGGQYRDGTTDITRTIAIGTPTQQMRADYTRVVKGHIALTQMVFPKGTTGQALDAFARQYLWQVGLDYDHGTGHGVGAVLNVHEGPARIAKPTAAPPVALEHGMLLSNEPGLYRAGEYGIRFENLVLVVALEDLSHNRPFMGFETVTFAPLDHDLLDQNLLTEKEHAWIADYERQIVE